MPPTPTEDEDGEEKEGPEKYDGEEANPLLEQPDADRDTELTQALGAVWDARKDKLGKATIYDLAGMVGEEGSSEYEWVIENTELTSYLAKTAIKSWLFTVNDDRDQWKYIMADLVKDYIGVTIEDPQSSQDGI